MVTATIQVEHRLIGVIRFDGGLVGSLSESHITLVGSLSAPSGYEKYTGPYEVTPSTVEQIMSTENKHLINNIVIHEIPYYNVSNSAGGSTVYIGNGVE